MFAIVQLLFLRFAAGSDWLGGCGGFCVWVGRRDNEKGRRDKNIADQCVRGANFENGS